MANFLSERKRFITARNIVARQLATTKSVNRELTRITAKEISVHSRELAVR